MIDGISVKDFNESNFLSSYWQKKPIIIRNMFAGDFNLITPNELAGLACEDGVESRLVIQTKTKAYEGDKLLRDTSSWNLRHGPFNEETFETITEPFWSLLVQSVDHWNPQVNTLLNAFDFLPAHILDDVMVSYAPEGGSVGAHFDYYDVFLIQGLGSREWSVGGLCDETTPTIENSELSILKNMGKKDTVILNTGDVLYLPAQLSHCGIALEDCITYSIGFRTPSMQQAIINLSDNVAENLVESNRLNLPITDSPFEINQAQISSIKKQVQSLLLNEESLTHWYGHFATEPKNSASILFPKHEYDDSMLIKALKESVALFKNEGSRFIYYINEDKSSSLFVDGIHYPLLTCSEIWLKALCSESKVFSDSLINNLNREKMNLYLNLLNFGSLYFMH